MTAESVVNKAETFLVYFLRSFWTWGRTTWAFCCSTSSKKI